MIHWNSRRTDTAPKYRDEMNWVITASLAILAVVALAVALIYTRKLMIPFVVALFIVALVSPIEDFQVKWLRLPRLIAVMVTLLIVLAVMALVSLFLVQSSRTIAYTAAEYSTSFYDLASRLLKPLEYVYKLEEPPQPVVPEAPKPPFGTTPSDLGPVEKKPEAVELFPVVKDADKPGVLDVRPHTSRPALPKAKGFDNSVLLNEGPPPSPPAPTKGTDAPATGRGNGSPASAGSTKEADKPAAPAARSTPSTATKDANEARRAAAEPNDAAKGQWRIDTRQIVKDLIDNVRQIMRDMANHMFAMLTNTVGVVFGLISGVLFVCIFVIFLLAGRNPYAEHSQMYRDVVVNIRRYLATKVFTSALVGVLTWASLALLGMELASVFGVLAFLLNFIPVIGPVTVTVLPIPLAMAQFQSLWPVILVVAVPGVIHNVIGNIIEPKMMGRGLDLHPVTVMLALSFWGLLWGIVGMFLAAPITAAIRIVLMQFDTFRPIANLLAGEFHTPQSEPPAVCRAVTRSAAPPSEAESAGSLH